ncbi:MAG: efflux RND transporter permease subunit, partial [Gammaproteobacteria bacterium]|nr:efflux RND transporter permease subunit [Gammaproteobacteria bacterium]
MVNQHAGEAKPGLLERLIAFSAHNGLLVFMLVLASAVWGYRSLISTPLDAIPDLSDVQVIVFTEWPGRSPDLVEDQITYPLTTTLLAAPEVRFVRGQSFMGLSFVYVIFEDGTDMYWARSRVLEYLNSATPKLPDNVRPTLGPDATGVGWVYQYALVDKTGNQSLADLRSLQDFNLRYALEAIKGVAEVASVGGFVKEYQINLDPNKLASYGIPLRKVITAVRASNNDVGGRVLEIAGHEHFIRGRGYVKSLADLEEVVLGVGVGGVPIRVLDVASVTLGPALQRGQADLDGEGIAVGGIVVMRYGENALDVIGRVKDRIEVLKESLPSGVEIIPVYDRSSLIERAIDTLRNTLIEEMVIVSFVIGIFLLHARSALVVVLTLPIAILLSFIPMFYQGLTANIMSLGGIAVAIGAMVDGAIVIVDNIHKRVQGREADGASRTAIIIEAMQEVGPSIFFS